MGGKRPDQHNIDPGEAMATDYKSRHADEHLLAEERQKVKATEEQDRDNLIPHRGKNPALEALQAKRAEAAEQQARAAEPGADDDARADA